MLLGSGYVSEIYRILLPTVTPLVGMAAPAFLKLVRVLVFRDLDLLPEVFLFFFLFYSFRLIFGIFLRFFKFYISRLNSLFSFYGSLPAAGMPLNDTTFFYWLFELYDVSTDLKMIYLRPPITETAPLPAARCISIFHTV